MIRLRKSFGALDVLKKLAKLRLVVTTCKHLALGRWFVVVMLLRERFEIVRGILTDGRIGRHKKRKVPRRTRGTFQERVGSGTPPTNLTFP